MNSPTQRGAALAKLHIAKKDLELAEESYRALLVRHGAPVDDPSAKHMRLQQIDNALKELISKGWKPKPRNVASRQSPASRHNKTKTRIDKIRAIWIQMHRDGFISDGSETALMNWIRKQTNAKDGQVDALEWLEQTGMTNTILEQLKAWDRRVRMEQTPCN